VFLSNGPGADVTSLVPIHYSRHATSSKAFDSAARRRRAISDEVAMLESFPLDHYPNGIAAIAASMVAILVCQSVLRKFIGADTLRQAHEVGGYYLSLVGTVYGILLGLVVFDAMSKFQMAERAVNNEAKSLLAIYSLADQFPHERLAIKALVRNYVAEVVDDEWPLMAKGEVSRKTHDTLIELMHVVRAIEPKSQNQQSIYAALLAATDTLGEVRLDRTKVSNFGIPTAEWVVLLVGAAIVIAFTFFFTTESHGVHLVMRGMVILLISMSLYLVLLFGAPFSGDLTVSNKPFRFIESVIAPG
jgi:hypothetical protein